MQPEHGTDTTGWRQRCQQQWQLQVQVLPAGAAAAEARTAALSGSRKASGDNPEVPPRQRERPAKTLVRDVAEERDQVVRVNGRRGGGKQLLRQGRILQRKDARWHVGCEPTGKRPRVIAAGSKSQ